MSVEEQLGRRAIPNYMGGSWLAAACEVVDHDWVGCGGGWGSMRYSTSVAEDPPLSHGLRWALGDEVRLVHSLFVLKDGTGPFDLLKSIMSGDPRVR